MENSQSFMPHQQEPFQFYSIKIAVDRVVQAVCNGNGSSSCLLHKKLAYFSRKKKFSVISGQTVINEKTAVFGTQGVLFTMSHITEAYLREKKKYKGSFYFANNAADTIPSRIRYYPNLFFQ
uniref:Uncharacterized protein n=1 Tax=Wuchereria bancrofti TaxID=6293 RepID=A0AAF5Q7I5_WUCBA